MHGVSLQFTHH